MRGSLESEAEEANPQPRLHIVDAESAEKNAIFSKSLSLHVTGFPFPYQSYLLRPPDQRNEKTDASLVLCIEFASTRDILASKTELQFEKRFARHDINASSGCLSQRV
jgi:hypothetical protein